MKRGHTRNEKDDKGLVSSLEQLVKGLKELRSTLIRWATVRAKGAIPGVFLELEVGHLSGVDGHLEMVFSGHGFRCRFQPYLSNEVERWESCESHGLDAYEEELFSAWSYDHGLSLESGVYSEAEWVIEDFGDANRLEDIANNLEQVVTAIGNLKDIPSAVSIGHLIYLIRNGKPKWMPCIVEWWYVQNLDKEIKNLQTQLKQIAEKGKIGPTAKPNAEGKVESVQEATGLTDTESNIIEALSMHVLTGEQLAKRAGYPYNSNFKNTLSSLRKRGILGNKAPGYLVEPEYHFLLSKSD